MKKLFLAVLCAATLLPMNSRLEASPYFNKYTYAAGVGLTSSIATAQMLRSRWDRKTRTKEGSQFFNHLTISGSLRDYTRFQTATIVLCGILGAGAAFLLFDRV